jgi:6-phospho-3-hexuloisomerase
MYTTAAQILAEIDAVLRRVDAAEVDRLVNAILNARRVIVYGLGREGLVMRSFAMRLMHLGVDVAVVGDMTTPPIGPGDLFLVSCGPGYLSTVEALMNVARNAGASLLMLTALRDADLPRQAGVLLVLPAQTMAAPQGDSSTQAMGSVYEQAMWILLDALVPVLQARLGQTVDDMRRRHTNLE